MTTSHNIRRAQSETDYVISHVVTRGECLPGQKIVAAPCSARALNSISEVLDFLEVSERVPRKLLDAVQAAHRHAERWVRRDGAEQYIETPDDGDDV